MIARQLDLAAQLASWVRADPRFDLAAPPRLNLVVLRLVAGDEATDALVAAANATGLASFTRTVLDGRSAIRVSIGGRTTEARHVEAAWALLQQLADD
jgi:aromatic-L-amino-acid decarboxylase